MQRWTKQLEMFQTDGADKPLQQFVGPRSLFQRHMLKITTSLNPLHSRKVCREPSTCFRSDPNFIGRILSLNVSYRSVQHFLAVVDHKDSFTHAFRYVHLVGGKDDSSAPPANFMNRLSQ